MNLLFYASTAQEVTKRLQKVIEMVVPGKNRWICRDIQGLSQRLREPADGQRIVVLSPSNRQDLSSIQSIRDLLSDDPIIIILPDRKADTVSMGHSLRPRFLTYFDSDFVELAGVLDKMLMNPDSVGI
jgi:hypothetical protein